MMNNTRARRNRRRVRLDAMVFNLVMSARLIEGKVDLLGVQPGNVQYSQAMVTVRISCVFFVIRTQC